jgi:nucleoside-diphosphate-sugar epimerase
MKTILITGAAGFVGRALCKQLAAHYKVIGLYHKQKPFDLTNAAWEQLSLTDFHSVSEVCEKYSPDVVIHCAAIAHQKFGIIDRSTYLRVNSDSTKNLAHAAVRANPTAKFIFLSSVSVYGEDNLNEPASEDDQCRPTSDYALSKLEAEKGLVELSDKGILHNPVILRLAPVYDRTWSFNLDRRVLAPMKISYIRFGEGHQKISALALNNLVDFVSFMLARENGDKLGRIALPEAETLQTQLIDIINVCDPVTYDFDSIIQIFKKSDTHPHRPVVCVPMHMVYLLTIIAGKIFHKKATWFNACYKKLALNMVFDNKRMLKTGFQPVYSMYSVFKD